MFFVPFLLRDFVSGESILWSKSTAGSSMLLQKLKIDDPVDAAPVHGFCGIWGVLACGLFDWGKGFDAWHWGTWSVNDVISPEVFTIWQSVSWKTWRSSRFLQNHLQMVDLSLFDCPIDSINLYFCIQLETCFEHVAHDHFASNPAMMKRTTTTAGAASAACPSPPRMLRAWKAMVARPLVLSSSWWSWWSYGPAACRPSSSSCWSWPAPCASARRWKRWAWMSTTTVRRGPTPCSSRPLPLRRRQGNKWVLLRYRCSKKKYFLLWVCKQEMVNFFWASVWVRLLVFGQGSWETHQVMNVMPSAPPGEAKEAWGGSTPAPV